MELTAIIHQVQEEYLSTSLAQSLQGINCGLCGDFATDVLLKLPSGLHSKEATHLSVASFQAVDESDDDGPYYSGRPFDRMMLRKHWPAVAPPTGLTWDDLDALSEDAGFDNGTHVWISAGGLHFDAECPAGTPNFFELPFFQRVIAGWLAEKVMAQTMIFTINTRNSPSGWRREKGHQMTENEAYNVAELGYKTAPRPEDALVQNRPGFHGRCGGDLDNGVFKGNAVFFAPSGEMASVFAEHIHLNRDNDVFGDEYLEAAPTVFPVLLTFENPVVVEQSLLRQIAANLGVKGDERITKFIEDFEDSSESERDQVFNWARQQGHDGVVILNDLMPVCAGGDWNFQTSYVAFEPEKQVKFYLSNR